MARIRSPKNLEGPVKSPCLYHLMAPETAETAGVRLKSELQCLGYCVNEYSAMSTIHSKVSMLSYLRARWAGGICAQACVASCNIPAGARHHRWCLNRGTEALEGKDLQGGAGSGAPGQIASYVGVRRVREGDYHTRTD